ncbi:EamA family transporter RarD [Pseudonocardia sp. H11422]|uniref:EamA family transporter RarD n=1 Tax=Pseudonocardia sp. H11422 TaxID=2835866 RepID=UPI0027E2D87B|nr:EamA family transporter RarD [Pseudonocardia sp. H11422]
MASAVGAYTIWGMFPAFWPLLEPAVPVEALAHRIAWTALLMVGVLTALHGWPVLRALSLRGWLMVAAAAGLITVNWALFIASVFTGRVVEAALGYFVSPLFSVLLGVLVLRERLRPAQWAALVLATAAVAVITVENGRVPWVSLVLGATFGLYGLIKKTVALDTVSGLTAESLVIGPLALATVVWFEAAGNGTLTGHGAGHVLLLLAGGPVTAVPMLLYGAAARRVPLSTIGVLMYLNPTLQFLWGVVVAGEDMPATRWAGFVLVWTALLVFTVDLLRQSRSPRPSPPPPRESGYLRA